MRFQLTPHLERLGFQATPFSFYHPQHEIVVEYARPLVASDAIPRPWVVTVGKVLLAKRAGRSRAYLKRRYPDAIGACEAGLRAVGVKMPKWQRHQEWHKRTDTLMRDKGRLILLTTRV